MCLELAMFTYLPPDFPTGVLEVGAGQTAAQKSESGDLGVC